MNLYFFLSRNKKNTMQSLGVKLCIVFDKIKGPEWARSRNGNVEKVN